MSERLGSAAEITYSRIHIQGQSVRVRGQKETGGQSCIRDGSQPHLVPLAGDDGPSLGMMEQDPAVQEGGVLERKGG